MSKTPPNSPTISPFMPNLDNLYLRYIQRMEEQMAQKDRKILELEAKVASLEYIKSYWADNYAELALKTAGATSIHPIIIKDEEEEFEEEDWYSDPEQEPPRIRRQKSRINSDCIPKKLNF